MTEAIIVALITGGITLVGTVISNMLNHSKTIYRIDILEKKVEKHNNLIERTYRLEERTTVQEEQIKTANHRIEELEDELKRA